MNRSPLSYPLNRGADLDGGGAADLQTDVMRFMAILSLCLVAIFALVQSIPVNVPPSPAEPSEAVPAVAVEPVPSAPVDRQTIAQMSPDIPRVPPSVDSPAPPAAPDSEPTESTTVSEVSSSETTFTLRFDSDTALKALVARDEIGLYALRDDIAMRLSNDAGRLAFWQASSPSQFHEMDRATVPNDVVQALARTVRDGNVRWAVTLPANLARQLERYLAGHTGGELVIAANGNMRLE